MGKLGKLPRVKRLSNDDLAQARGTHQYEPLRRRFVRKGLRRFWFIIATGIAEWVALSEFGLYVGIAVVLGAMLIACILYAITDF
jgi:hypothetical protein